MTQQPISFPIGGGLDLVSPPLAKKPGTAVAALNYEPVATGYRRLRGYERFDGRTAPSAGGNRNSITAVGANLNVGATGPVRGIHFYNGAVIAARDVSGEGMLFQATILGWTLVSSTRTVAYTSGDLNFQPVGPGDTLIGATSGTSAFVVSKTLTSGSYAAGTAAGLLTLTSQNAAFVAENLDHFDLGNSNVATIAGNSTATTPLATGGTYKFMTHNFYGASDLTKIYGVNGVNKGFYIDWAQQLMTVITTGMATDTPIRQAEHRGSLFYAFPGGSVQFSTVGDPTSFTPITGAGEIGIGTEITDLAPLPNALAILGDTSIHVLYGSDSSDYQLEGLNEEAGALAHTAQNFGNLIYMDNRGLRSLAAAQKFGNFTTGTLSRLIAPLLEKKRRDGVDPSASLVCRTHDQYYLFFDDGTGIIVYLGGKEPAILPFNLGITVTCATSEEDDGVERLFVGASNGFVYELNKGTSFDGSAIEHYVALAYNNMGNSEQEKRCHKCIIQVEASGTTTIAAAARFNLGSIDGPDAQTVTLTTGGSGIDDLGTGESYYAGLTPYVGEVYFDGVFRDISLKISGSQASQEPHTLTGVTYLVSPRGLRR